MKWLTLFLFLLCLLGFTYSNQGTILHISPALFLALSMALQNFLFQKWRGIESTSTHSPYFLGFYLTIVENLESGRDYYYPKNEHGSSGLSRAISAWLNEKLQYMSLLLAKETRYCFDRFLNWIKRFISIIKASMTSFLTNSQLPMNMPPKFYVNIPTIIVDIKFRGTIF